MCKNWKEQEMFESESVQLGIMPIRSVISKTPMMRTSEWNSTSVVNTQKKGLKPVISRNKVDERLKAFLKHKLFSSPINNYGCVLNKKKDHDSDQSQMLAPGLQNF